MVEGFDWNDHLMAFTIIQFGVFHDLTVMRKLNTISLIVKVDFLYHFKLFEFRIRRYDTTEIPIKQCDWISNELFKCVNYFFKTFISKCQRRKSVVNLFKVLQFCNLSIE